MKKISEFFRKPSAVFFFPQPPEIPPLKCDLRTLPNDVISNFSKNIIMQFEQAKVYQMSVKELYPGKDGVLSHPSDFPEDMTELCNYFRRLLGFPLSAQKARKSTKIVFEIYREQFYD